MTLNLRNHEIFTLGPPLVVTVCKNMERKITCIVYHIGNIRHLKSLKYDYIVHYINKMNT